MIATDAAMTMIVQITVYRVRRRVTTDSAFFWLACSMVSPLLGDRGAPVWAWQPRGETLVAV